MASVADTALNHHSLTHSLHKQGTKRSCHALTTSSASSHSLFSFFSHKFDIFFNASCSHLRTFSPESRYARTPFPLARRCSSRQILIRSRRNCERWSIDDKNKNMVYRSQLDDREWGEMKEASDGPPRSSFSQVLTNTSDSKALLTCRHRAIYCASAKYTRVSAVVTWYGRNNREDGNLSAIQRNMSGNSKR